MIYNVKKIFAIVLNYNGYDDSKECILSLINSNYKLNIVLVDNNSTDDSFIRLKHEYPNLISLYSEINLGYAGGMNIGIEYAISNKGDYIILINQDVVVTPDFFEPIIKKFEDDSEIGIVSSKVLYKGSNNVIYCAGGRISKLLCTGVAEYQGKLANKYANEDREISLAEGCFLTIKSVVIEKIGLLNEKYFMYLEDVEFSERVGKYFKIYYVSNSIVYHKSGAGRSWSEFTTLYNYYYTRNRIWHFAHKNIFEKAYVILLSLGILILKTINIIVKNVDKKNKSLRSLWKGFIDGILLINKNNF